MKLHTVVPTIMTNPKQEFRCIEQIVRQFDNAALDFKIYFVANFPIKEFGDYIPTDKRIIKSISNLPFSISRAVNSIFQTIEYDDDDVLAFVQSDAFFKNPQWISELIDILNTEELNAGVVGLRPHLSCNQIESAINFKGKFDIHPVEWTDGVMLFKGSRYRQVGGFDENYFGDCESQDFCYLVAKEGYTNYWCSDKDNFFGYENRAAHFVNKARFNRKEFLHKVEFSRQYLKNKWS